MKRLFLLGLASLSCESSVVHALPPDITMQVDARDIARQRVHTKLDLSVRPGPITLAYPKWIPGEHAPTGPLNSIIGLEIRANGRRLEWLRDPLDVYAFHLDVPLGVSRLQISIESGLSIGGAGFSGAQTASQQLAILPWNEFILLEKGRDAQTTSATGRILLPPGWVAESALDSRVTADGGYEFESVSVSQLIDSPVQIGRFAKLVDLKGAEPRSDIGHRISIVAEGEGALCVPEEFVAGMTRLVAEAGQLFGSRMYRHYTWLVTLSNHVAHFGLEHHESSDDRADENALCSPDLRMGLAGHLSHEYVHSWNGKYRRPLGLLSPDYQKPMDGSLLWVYEGLTQYWGFILAARSGLVTSEMFRDHLAELAGLFEIEPGARWRSLADTAVSAQTLYSAPDSWRSNRRDTDFYDASVFLWLDVDAELRRRTNGAASIDDFARRFYAGVSGASRVKPYQQYDLYRELSAVNAEDWQALIGRHLDLPGTSAITAAIEHTGWRLTLSSARNQWVDYLQKVNRRIYLQWSIGLSLTSEGDVVDVIEGRAAALAGAAPGMKLVAVNGRAFSSEILQAAICEAQQSRAPIVLLVQLDGVFRLLSVSYFDGLVYPHLVRIPNSTDSLSSAQERRAP